MSGKRHSTIGYEKKFNHAFKPATKEAFREALLKDMPPAPHYFQRSTYVNCQGPRVLGEPPKRKEIPPRLAAELLRGGHVLLDIRTPEAFGGAHVEGAYNVWFSPMISTWAGWVLPYDRPVILLLEDEDQWEETVRQLVRVGFDDIAGFVDGGIESWVAAGLPASHLAQLSVQELKDMMAARRDLMIVDVRTDAEYRSGHIAGAINIHAGQVNDRYQELDRDKPIALVCRSAHRSSIAGSILLQHGFERVYNVSGGITAWGNAGYAVMTR
jgi:hydroxyacylglutathione hydrolase